MPDFTRTVTVAFLGEDRVTKTIDGITGRVDAFAGRVADATQPLATLTDNILKIEAAFAALAVGGLAIAIKTAGDFGDSFAEITTLVDDVDFDIHAFRQSILDYSRDSVKSIDDINESIYQAISAGTKYQDALTYLEQAEKLSVATKGQLSETIKLVSQTMNAYAGSTLTAQQASDLIFTTIKSGVTRIDELSASLGKVLPIAAQLNIPFETIAAALAALTKTGLSTSEAVTSLTSLLNSFLKPTSEAAQITEQLGFKWDSATVKNQGFIETLQKAIVAVKGDDEAISRLTGRKEALIAALVLGVDKAGLFNQALDDMAKAAGSTEIAYEKMVNEFGNMNQMLINNLKATLIQFAGPLMDEYAETVADLSGLLKSIGTSIQAGDFDPLIELLENLISDIGTYFAKIAKVLPEAMANIDWSDFIKSLNNLGGAIEDLFKAFFGEIDLTTAEGLTDFIQKIINGFTTLTNITKGILDAFKPFIEQIGKMVDKFSEMDEGAAEFIGNILGWGKVVNEIAGNIGALTGSLNFLAQAFTFFIGAKMLSAIGQLTQFGTASTGLLGVITKLNAALAAFGVGFVIGKLLADNIPYVDQFGKGLADMVLSMQGLGEEQILAIEDQAKHTEAMGKAAVAAVRLAEDLGTIPGSKTTEYLAKGTPEYEAELQKMIEYVKSVPETKDTTLKAIADEQSAKEAYATIKTLTTDPETGEEIWIETKVKIDQPSIDETKKSLETLDTEKIIIARIENQTKLEIEQIKASAETVQKAMEWKAKIDIAEIEAVFETLQKQGENIAVMFVNTGEVLQSMLNALGDLGPLGRSDLLALMEKEIEIRAKLAEQQAELTAAEIRYLDAKTQALAAGEGFINITMDGVYPELELIMRKLIEQTQIRANAEGLEFLLGA